MAGQSDAPDDLIAELARLMAGEARPESAPKEPQAAPAQPRIRIPGDDIPSTPPMPQMPPVPRFNFAGSPPPPERPAPAVPSAQQQPVAAPHAAPAQAAPVAPRQPVTAAPAAAPVQPQQAPAPRLDNFGLRPSVAPTPQAPVMPAAEQQAEPFSFDFDLRSAGRASPAPSAPVAPPAPRVEAAPQAQPQVRADNFAPRREPAPEPVAPQRPVEPTAAPVRQEPVQAAVVPPAQVRVEETPEPLNLDHDSLADLIAAELANDQNDAFNEPVVEAYVEEVAPETVPAQEEDFFAQVASQTRAPEPQPTVVPNFAAPVEPAAPQFTQPTFEVSLEPAAPSQAQARQEPAFGSDPLSDIERLVGPAVRMGVQPEPEEEPLAQPEYKPTPAPLRSLATPTLPPENEKPTRGPRRRASTVDSASVDDAILAAAAASGARVEWVDHAPSSELDESRDYDEPRKRRSFGLSRAVLGPLVALLLLGVGGGALYFMLGKSGPSGPAPTIVADTQPVKEVPERTETTPSQSVIFNEMSGGNNGAGEQIVPRDQADAETISEATQNTGIGNVINSIDQGTSNPDGLVNRRVRTVTVRPDGTIVSGDSGLAGTSMLPVDRPNVPDLPGNTATAATTTTTAAVTPAPTPAPAVEAPVAPTVTPVQPGSTVPVANASGSVIAGRTVAIPSQKPSDFAATAQAAIAAAASAPTPAASAPQNLAAPAAAAPAATPAGGGAYVQLSSQRTEQAARESAQAIATRFGVLFGGANLEIQQVNLGERGIYYRVLVPTASREAAVNVCTNVKAAGGDCLLL